MKNNHLKCTTLIKSTRIVFMEIFYAHILGFLSLLEVYPEKESGKKFLEKNLEIKTLEKSPNFIKSLEKMSLCFGFLGLFFLK